MLKTGLEFAPGTTDASKQLVASLFTPTEILGAYKSARNTFKNGDLVLVVSQSDPSGFRAEPRTTYLKRLRASLGVNAGRTMPALGINNKSAHSVVQLPFDSDAFWLIVTRGQELPVMCVLYAMPYQDSAQASQRAN
jgi:hypothetical protein